MPRTPLSVLHHSLAAIALPGMVCMVLMTCALFTGVQSDVLTDTYSFDSQLCWRVSRPYPATITAIGPSLSTQDE